MATPTAAAAVLAFCLCLNLAISRTIAQEISSRSSKVVRLQLIPRDSPQSQSSSSFPDGGLLTENDRLSRAILRSHARAATIVSKLWAYPGGYQAPVSPANGEFLLELTIGSPSLRFQAILDTGSDLIWTQCRPCENCFNQPTPIFEPSTSNTYAPSSCGSTACQELRPETQCNSKSQCTYSYADGVGSNSTGILATEAFTFMAVSFVHVVFGCGHSNFLAGFPYAAGVVGFGRGKLSLPSQYASSVGSDGVSFAYCLVSVLSGSSPLWLGPNSRSKFPGGSKTASTPLILNPSMKSLYYVSLTGIDVAGTAVGVPRGAFDVKSDGSGGLILDAGTTLTYLESRTYGNLIRLLISAIRLKPLHNSSVGLDLCYQWASLIDNTFPIVTLTFRGGAKLQWKPVNYMVRLGADLVCAALVSSSDISIIGNIGQLNFFLLFDTSANELSFAPAQCESL